MGLRCNARVVSRERLRLRALRGSASHAVLALAAAAFLTSPVWADIDSGTTVKASTLSGSSSTLAGGTVELDSAKSYSRDWSLKSSTSSTIDALGLASTLSGNISGSGNVTFSSSVTGGTVTLTNSGNDYTGTTTITSGTTLALYDSDTDSDTNTTSGSIEHSQRLVNNGTFDISGTVSGATIISLSGSGNIVLGSRSLTLNDYDSDEDITYDTNTTFSGVISGKGGLALTSGIITLTGVNTYTGITTVSTDTLYLTGDGSISQSSNVYVYGTLNASGANSVVLKSLSGSGTVVLGTNDLVLNNASGSFTGTITGSGELILNSGTQYLSGTNSFTTVVINGGELEVGSDTVSYNVQNSGTFTFYNSSVLTMTGVISGTGDVTKEGSAITTISTAQTYTGATTITAGTIKLTDAGSLATSSGVEVDSILDLTESTNAAITSLTGTGTVRLGTESLTITGGAGDFSGTITGSGTLTISGGSQSFSGTNTYTGATTVSGGTMVLVAGASLKSAVTLATGTSIDLSSGVTITGSATIGSLSGTGSVNLGANTLVLSAAAGTFSGTITGTGSLWISGGTETLSGTSTYTGTTTVSAGTLTLTGSLATTSKLNISGTLDATGAADTTLTFVSLAGAGAVELGTHALVLNTASGVSTVFSGVLSGDASLTISGSGTQALSGANTYSGITTVNSGATLQIGNGSSSGSIASTEVVNNGTLKFYRLDSSTFSSVISGTGDVVQAGIGTTILTGDNTYTGTTTISAGTLQIGDGTTSGSIAYTSSIIDNGTLAFASPGAVTINTTISGAGSVSILSGTVTLTSVNTYTGVTKIASDATLALTNTANINTSDSVTINGTLDLSGLTTGITLKSLAGSGAVDLGTQDLTLTAASTTFSGVVSGSGGLILSSSNTGTQVLSGISTYTGATLVNGGTLSVTGSIANSAVSVASGATLTGSGTVGALTVASGGTVSGTLGSTLTSSGNISLASGSNYTISLTSTHSDSAVLSTSGSASVDGTIITIASTDGTFDLGNKIKILSASSITGNFEFSNGSTTTTTFTGSDVGGNNEAVFKATLDTATSGITYLQINLYQLSPAITAISGATLNQKLVAAGIDKAIAAGSTLSAGFESLGNNTTSELQTNTNQLSGEIGADAPLAAKAAFLPFLDALSTRTAMQRPLVKGQVQPLETWISAYGGTDIVTGDATGDGSHKFRSSVAGIVAGAQWMPWSNVVLGGAISAGTSNFRVAEDLGKGSVKSLQAGVYGYIQTSRHFYNSFAAGVGVSEIKTNRVVTVSDTDELTGKLTTVTFGGRYEAGLQLPWVTPYIGVQDHVTMLPGYTEGVASGTSTFALKYDSRTYNSGRVELGLRHYIDLDVTPRWILTPDFTLHINDRLAWAHDLSDGSQSNVVFDSLSSSDFTVFGAKAKRDAVLGSVGADVLFNNGVRLTAHLDTAFSQKSQSFTGFAGVGYTW